MLSENRGGFHGRFATHLGKKNNLLPATEATQQIHSFDYSLKGDYGSRKVIESTDRLWMKNV